MINLEPIGIVHNDFLKPDKVRVSVPETTIEIYPPYADALLRLEEHTHIWVLGWFHQAQRDVLRVIPRINKDLPEYGVFGLRAFSRPNPIGLSVVRLIKIDNNIIKVEGLDFIDGTPVIDIKPYYEHDIVFSPGTPYIKPQEPAMLEEMMLKEALVHHQEECEQSIVAVKMCLAAESVFGKITAPEINVSVQGSRCLGDTVQGLTRARLAHPDRFTFLEDPAVTRMVWKLGNCAARIILKDGADLQGIKDKPFAELVVIEMVDV